LANQLAKRKLCFVIGPIGKADSDARIHADWLLEEIVEPVFAEFPDYDVVRSDKIASPGMIDAQIIQHLFDADIVVADLSRLNANTFYEIGIRHMHARPIIHMQLVDDEIPFDVSLYRAIRFSRIRPTDLKDARKELRSAVQAILSPDYKVDNPITRSRGQIKLVEGATPSEKVLLEQVRAFQYRLERIEKRQAGISQDSSYDNNEDEFEEFARDATRISFKFDKASLPAESLQKQLIKLFPSEVVKGYSFENGQFTVQTIPGFMISRRWDEVYPRVRELVGNASVIYSK
jgi:hypothetical protein